MPLTYGFTAGGLHRSETEPARSVGYQGGNATAGGGAPFLRRAAQAPGPGDGPCPSGTALVLHYGFGRKRAAKGVLAVLAAAAGLEAFFGLCLACRMFPVLMKLGLVPKDTCEKCANIWAGSPTSEGDTLPGQHAQVGRP